MTTETDATNTLVAAHRAGARTVDQAALASVDRATAYRVQAATMAALGEKAGLYKIAISPDGMGVIAPIYATHVGKSGALRLSASQTLGLEVEIGMELARDLPPGSDRAAVEAAIGRCFVGIEICGTRFKDRDAAAFDAGLADQMSAFGYAIGTADWTRGTDIDGPEVVLKRGDEVIHRAPQKHSFGGVLEALLAYAKLAEQPYPLTAGTVVTTGSMCGLVRSTAPGPVTAEFGGHTVTLELV